MPGTLQSPGKELSEVESHTYHTDRHPLLRGSGGVGFVLLQDTCAQLLQELQRTKSKEVFSRDDSRTMELQNLHLGLHLLTQGTKLKDSVVIWTVLSLLVLKLGEKLFLQKVSSKHSITNYCTKRKSLGHRVQSLHQLMLRQGRSSVVVLALPKFPGDSAEQQNSAETSRLEAEGAFPKVSGVLHFYITHTYALNIRHHSSAFAKHTDR